MQSGGVSRNFITSRDVEDRWLAGERDIRLGPDDVVTAEAQERATRLGVRLTRIAAAPAAEVAAQAPPGEGMAAERAPEMVSAVQCVPRAERTPALRADWRLDLLVEGGRVVIPGEGIFETDVWVKDGRVVGLASHGPGAAEVIDARGKLVLPGVVDPHVHLGLFSPLEEDLESETRSALLGGVTTIGCFFGGSDSHLPLIERLPGLVAEHSAVDLFPHLVIGTRQQLEEIPRYVEQGVTSFKLYMCGLPGLIPEVDDGFLLAALRRCAEAGQGCVVCVHAENAAVVAWATKESGRAASLRQWAETHPALAEEEAIRCLCCLARVAGATVYVVHVTSAGGLQAVREARDAGTRVFAEVASPYLVATWDSDRGSVAKMVPPFRGEEDREALWRGVEDGTVTALGTDNVTLTAEQKGLGKDLWDVMPGYPALATHLPAVLTEGVLGRSVSPVRIAELMCRQPAQVFGLFPRKGTLLPGSDADAVVVDLQQRRIVRSQMLGSRAEFSLFEGRELAGWPSATVKGGRVVVHDGVLAGNLLRGRLIMR